MFLGAAFLYVRTGKIVRSRPAGRRRVGGGADRGGCLTSRFSGCGSEDDDRASCGRIRLYRVATGARKTEKETRGSPGRRAC